MNRWKMNKLGFVNFWLYDVEEFCLESGHILLRGANASGKSITTQSFIPFLLDGNKSPERLDPFGSRDRKMEFYLLGDDERDDSTGYLYLELKREGVEDYLTVGVGMRAQRGKSMDFWGFCLCDGRRVGPGGVELCERVGRQLMPLSRQKLKNLLHDADNWADSPGAYEALVNNRVFRFQDIRQYKQLVSLLIKVRAPKLSRDFRPTEVKKVLNDSLQVLTDDDLSAMVSSMERMDELERTLRDFRAAMHDAGTIRTAYTRYCQFILGRKGQAYLEAGERRERLQTRFEEKKEEVARQTALLEAHAKAGEEAGALLEQARAARAALGDGDLTAKRRQLEADEEARGQLSRRMEADAAQAREMEESISRREASLREMERRRTEAAGALRTDIERLEEHNEILAMGDEHAAYLARLAGGDPEGGDSAEADRQILLAALRRRREQVHENLRLLRRVEEARTAYDDACRALDEATALAAAAKAELREAQGLEQEARDLLTEAVVRRHAENRELRLSEAEFVALRQAVARYRSPADWSGVRQLVETCYHGWHSRLLEARVEAERELRDAAQRVRALEEELAGVRLQPDPAPPRAASVEAARIQLALRGIPHAALYEAVDFRPDLPQERRDLLEAQLLDAGLLDALVAPQEYAGRLGELLEEYPDRFLIAGEPAADPIGELIPDGDGALREAVERCLGGISRSDPQAPAALLPDGTYANGVLRGRSLAERPAGYVGAAARRANRERRILELETELAKAREQQGERQAGLGGLSARLALLEEERAAMPGTAELDRALDFVAQAEKKAGEAQKLTQRCEADEQERKRRAGQLEQESREQCRGLPYARTVEAYGEAGDAAEVYGGALSAVHGDWITLRSAREQAESLEDTIGEQRDHAADLRRAGAGTRRMMETVEARIREVQAFLDRPENRERAARLQQLDGEIARQEKALRDAETQCAELRGALRGAAAEMQRQEEELAEARGIERDLRDYFAEDPALSLTQIPRGGDLSARAKEARGLIPPGDREHTPEKMGEALQNTYQQNNNTLLKYLPKLETALDAPARPGMLRQRLVLTLQKEGRELSLGDFIGQLQKDIDLKEAVLEQRDRELFEDILTDTVSQQLRRRIEESGKWSRDMNSLMETLDTSMGLSFSLDWKPRRAQTGQELDTERLVKLLSKDRALLTREDSQAVSEHFRSKVRAARQEAELAEHPPGLADVIRGVLDYRTWYEFRLYYRRTGEERRELSDRAFNKFSGGEKAMAMYLPQFCAVSAQYHKGAADCPVVLALDEAFAGVDEKNIGAMFGLVYSLGFDYIMNSQALWGCYACVRDLDIADFHRPANAPFVTILRYHWNGREKTLKEE